MGGVIGTGAPTAANRRHAPLEPTSSVSGPSLDRTQVLVILLTMEAAQHVPLAEVKSRLSELVDRLQREHGRVVITKHGRPAAVIMTLEDLESLEETLEILSQNELLEEIHEAEAEVAEGRSTPLSKDEAIGLVMNR
jgi:antitoxin YefM